jgi:7-keto-8-aminopelargonate synthetase-like enzyme
MTEPLDRLADALYETQLIRHFHHLFEHCPDLHMKDMTVEEVGPGRRVRIRGQWVVNFGSDSFLGLDQDPRLHAALERGIKRWGSHNGTSRAFASVDANVEAERKLARWMRAECALIYPSVTLANLGALPALVTRRDAIAYDQFAHNSVQQGIKLAKAGGVRAAAFAHNDPDDLRRTLQNLRPYRHALIACDGVYSMSGSLPPLAEFRAIARDHDAILYVDDAHGTGIIGEQGRGVVLDALGDYRNAIVVGSLSKALSCLGGFIICPERVLLLLKLRSAPLIFGGPVAPAYLDAICVAVDILASDEYWTLRGRLDANMQQFLAGMRDAGVPLAGGIGAIASVPIGDTMSTLAAGRELFERGYYVQSVIFPAVPHHGGLLRVQINANHTTESIAGLIEAVANLAAFVRPTARLAAGGKSLRDAI